MTTKIFFIPGAVPSSKNSRIMTRSGFFIGSKATQKYRKLSKSHWDKYRDEFKKLISLDSKPIILGLHFVRASKHKWDFINPAQTIQDEMVRNEWIEDDNVDELLPVPLFINGQYWSYDKSNAGVYVAVLSSFCEGFEQLNLNENTSNY